MDPSDTSNGSAYRVTVSLRSAAHRACHCMLRIDGCLPRRVIYLAYGHKTHATEVITCMDVALPPMKRGFWDRMLSALCGWGWATHGTINRDVDTLSDPVDMLQGASLVWCLRAVFANEVITSRPNELRMGLSFLLRLYLCTCPVLQLSDEARTHAFPRRAPPLSPVIALSAAVLAPRLQSAPQDRQRRALISPG